MNSKNRSITLKVYHALKMNSKNRSITLKVYHASEDEL